MKDYPSNISREEFELIREELENARKKTKPRQVDLYEVFCAILYILKSGCQWDMLPADFPKKSTVYYYFQTWTKEDENGNTRLGEVLKKLTGLWRIDDGRRESTRFCIINAQSVQNADTAGPESRARRKILCKRNSTKSRMALEKQCRWRAESLGYPWPSVARRYARRRRECRRTSEGTLKQGVSRRHGRRT